MEKTAIRILLADDDESDRLLFKDAFKELKIKTIVHTVNNGTQLMDHLAKNDIALPHLIFLDLNMPHKNGLECLKEIRSNKKFKEIEKYKEELLYTIAHISKTPLNSIINMSDVLLYNFTKCED